MAKPRKARARGRRAKEGAARTAGARARAAALAALFAKVAPPPQPVGAGGDWAAVERRIGAALPADYKAIVERYGAGQFLGFIWVASPFAPPGSELELGGFSAWAGRSLDDASRAMQREPAPLFPAAGGLLPFGNTENSNHLSWVTDGPPDGWRVAVWDLDFARHHEQRGGLAQLLLDVIGGTSPLFEAGVFPADVVGRTSFVPAPPG